jgi:hypothetical protein
MPCGMAPFYHSPVGLQPPHRSPSFRIAYGGPAADFPVLGLQSNNNHDLDLFKGENTFLTSKKSGNIALGKSSLLYALLPLRAFPVRLFCAAWKGCATSQSLERRGYG